MTPTESDWRIRLYVYEKLVAGGSAPDADAVAVRFGIPASEARFALQRLHDAHALVLGMGRSDIVMAHPISAVPTDYRVFIDGRELYANCAWDSLGVSAMLGADARVEARHPLSGEVIEYAVEGGELDGECNCVVHFALPFRRWYDDIVDT